MHKQAGTVLRVDVTEYVQACAAAGKQAAFVIYRPMRRAAFNGNAGGPVAADDLSGGVAAVFGSPALRVMSTTVAPPARASPAAASPPPGSVNPPGAVPPGGAAPPGAMPPGGAADRTSVV